MSNPIQTEFRNLKHKQQILGILLFSLVTIVVWVGISLITSQRETAISPELQRLALPLNPVINVEIIAELEQKRAYDPSQLSSFPIYTLIDAEDLQDNGTSTQTRTATTSTGLGNLTPLIPSPSPSPSPEPNETDQTATPSATPTATDSGQTSL